ncbi:MAG: glycosyltransferase family 25 protein, partial [Bauldia sp.]|nr:glycosyltransferase family 25 protein [Bauldia sp.]
MAMVEAGRSGAADAFPDAYVINLKRTPERLAAFLKQNSGTGIDFKRFEAADGGLIGDEEAIRIKLVKPGTRWRTAATIGVALSHRNLWEAAIAEDRPRLVFEDDAFVRDDLRTVFAAAVADLAAWDIILLGYNTDALVEFNIAGDF